MTTLIKGDCIEELKNLKDKSCDVIIANKRLN